MRAAVSGEYLVVEVLDAETETRHPDVLQRFEFRLVQRTRLALKRDLFRICPTHVPIQTLDEITQLPVADVRRSAAAELNETKSPSLKRSGAAVEFVLLDQRVEIDLDLGSVLVGVDLEVTKQAALAAERNVQIQTEWIVDARPLRERIERLRHKLRLPLRERRVVRDKIIPDLSSRLRYLYSHEFSKLASTAPDGQLGCIIPRYYAQSNSQVAHAAKPWLQFFGSQDLVSLRPDAAARGGGSSADRLARRWAKAEPERTPSFARNQFDGEPLAKLPLALERAGAANRSNTRGRRTRQPLVSQHRTAAGDGRDARRH